MLLARTTLTSATWLRDLALEARLSLTFHFVGLSLAVGRLNDLDVRGDVVVDGGAPAIVAGLRPFPADDRGVAMVAVDLQLSRETAERVQHALDGTTAGRSVAIDLSHLRLSVTGLFGQRVDLPVTHGLTLRRGIEIGLVHGVSMRPPVSPQQSLDRKVVRA